MKVGQDTQYFRTMVVHHKLLYHPDIWVIHTTVRYNRLDLLEYSPLIVEQTITSHAKSAHESYPVVV